MLALSQLHDSERSFTLHLVENAPPKERIDAVTKATFALSTGGEYYQLHL